jgi:hypothetical protein
MTYPAPVQYAGTLGSWQSYMSNWDSGIQRGSVPSSSLTPQGECRLSVLPILESSFHYLTQVNPCEGLRTAPGRVPALSRCSPVLLPLLAAVWQGI